MRWSATFTRWKPLPGFFTQHAALYGGGREILKGSAIWRQPKVVGEAAIQVSQSPASWHRINQLTKAWAITPIC